VRECGSAWVVIVCVPALGEDPPSLMRHPNNLPCHRHTSHRRAAAAARPRPRRIQGQCTTTIPPFSGAHSPRGQRTHTRQRAGCCRRPPKEKRASVPAFGMMGAARPPQTNHARTHTQRQAHTYREGLDEDLHACLGWGWCLGVACAACGCVWGGGCQSSVSKAHRKLFQLLPRHHEVPSVPNPRQKLGATRRGGRAPAAARLKQARGTHGQRVRAGRGVGGDTTTRL
jgi:hypothetical protein